MEITGQNSFNSRYGKWLLIGYVTIDLRLIPSHGLTGSNRIVGSEEARLRAGLRPPPKLHRRICRMQLSRRLNETREKEKELKRAGAQVRTRRKAGTQATVSSHLCASA
jgi:hypothetical protein